MNKRLITVCLFSAIVAPTALADHADVLKNRLNHLNNFHAIFIQRVMNAKGTLIQEGEGKLWIKRPNLFSCKMIKPNDSILVCDGNTLWYYNSFFEQVTAYSIKDIIEKTPFILITCNNTFDWDQYNVDKKGDNFVLIPKKNSNKLKKITINVRNNGIVDYFDTIETNNQHISYQLHSQQIRYIDNSQFQFVPPKGVILDDQRH
ncbi:periplasmic chaperone LolA [secondary endosymbiont of Heteropsylla cubana]|uniref:Outer-membrane lipoprotein carrier protein n=1 Tax=secondary endosymbiont of Heteropsylla cubana TaxID=134287 RepID=J3TH02_9ENTR|nr:outer membrane lipoprotein chaperone LolA [secondary endosymbiont of Heteropsylla cubana]AFP85817.1 periplasmic chaperone LolA [secondary endosymbiont of Heteropsylla cubana]